VNEVCTFSFRKLAGISVFALKGRQRIRQPSGSLRSSDRTVTVLLRGNHIPQVVHKRDWAVFYALVTGITNRLLIVWHSVAQTAPTPTFPSFARYASTSCLQQLSFRAFISRVLSPSPRRLAPLHFLRLKAICCRLIGNEFTVGICSAWSETTAGICCWWTGTWTRACGSIPTRGWRSWKQCLGKEGRLKTAEPAKNSKHAFLKPTAGFSRQHKQRQETDRTRQTELWKLTSIKQSSERLVTPESITPFAVQNLPFVLLVTKQSAKSVFFNN